MNVTLTEKRFFEWHEDDKSVTLRSKSGSYGGQRGTYCEDKCGPICARDYKGVGTEYVEEGKLIISVKSI